MTIGELIRLLSEFDFSIEVKMIQPRTENEVDVTGVDWIVPPNGKPFVLIDDYPHG